MEITPEEKPKVEIEIPEFLVPESTKKVSKGGKRV
jgi:hypothetical protein